MEGVARARVGAEIKALEARLKLALRRALEQRRDRPQISLALRVAAARGDLLRSRFFEREPTRRLACEPEVSDGGGPFGLRRRNSPFRRAALQLTPRREQRGPFDYSDGLLVSCKRSPSH